MIKQIFYAWKSVSHSPRQTIIKSVSLCFGIGVAALLMSWVAYLKSYDTCYYDYDRLYQLRMSWILSDRTIPPSSTIIGKLAEGIYEEMPDIVESAVSMRGVRQMKIGKDGKLIQMRVAVTDSLFFETMGIEVLSGNPRMELRRPDVAFISEDIAKKYYGDESPRGKDLWYDGNSFQVRIAGVFKTIPQNSTVTPDIVVSLPSILSRIKMNYSWNGGDSWKGYVRIKEGVKISDEEFDRRINEVVQRHAPDKNGIGIRGHARLMRDSFQKDDGNRMMSLVLTVLAVTMLLITALNYVLVSIASLSRRAKSVGVHKCSGAQKSDVLKIFVYETLIIVVGALGLLGLVLLQFHEFIEETLKSPLSMLFAPERMYVSLGVVVSVFFIGALIPGIIMSKISVTSVFRRFSENRNRWKNTLLFIQFAGVSMIIGLLVTVWMQYMDVMTRDVGYNESGLVVAPAKADYNIDVYMTMLRNLPYVEDVVASGSIPPYSYSGSMVRDNQGRNIFSTRFDCIDKNYFDFMGFKLLAGRKSINGREEVIANRKFCDDMGWDVKSAIGKTVDSGNGIVKITGVMEDVCIGSFYDEPQPILLYSADAWPGNANTVTLRLKAPFDHNFALLKDAIAEAFPNITSEGKSFVEIKRDDYADIRIFGNIVLIAGISILFISFMGLVGYINDEIQRRSKEIAIRKVNGADVGSIVSMLAANVLKVAVPAVVIGGISAWRIEAAVMKGLPVSIEKPWLLCIVSSLAVLIAIIASVVFMTWRTANSNPTENLRNE